MRYFFHLDGPDVRLADVEGVDLPDAESACAEGADAAREIASWALRSRRDYGIDRVVVVDAQDTAVCTFAIRDILAAAAELMT